MGFDDLARVIADIRPGVNAAVFASGGALALRFREDAAVTLAPSPADSHVAHDRATGLAIRRSPIGEPPRLTVWEPRLLDYPRYLVAVDPAGDLVALRPLFVSGLFPRVSPLWSGEIWALPPATSIAPGTFVFTTDGALAGLAVEYEGSPALVPAALVLNAAERLRQENARAPGEIGIVVQPLSPDVAAATGARAGVVVTAVDPRGPAAGKLVTTDVVEAVNGQEIGTPEVWRAHIARLHSGDAVLLRVRSNGEVRDVQLTAAPTPAGAVDEPSDEAELGVRLRAIPTVGSEVLFVEPRSHASRAGLQPGHIITVAGRQTAPAPRQVIQAFGALPDGGVLLVAVTRGTEHRVVALKK
jgi:hypothetical protein